MRNTEIRYVPTKNGRFTRHLNNGDSKNHSANLHAIPLQDDPSYLPMVEALVLLGKEAGRIASTFDGNAAGEKYAQLHDRTNQYVSGGGKEAELALLAQQCEEFVKSRNIVIGKSPADERVLISANTLISLVEAFQSAYRKYNTAKDHADQLLESLVDPRRNGHHHPVNGVNGNGKNGR